MLCKVQCSILTVQFWPSGSRIFSPESCLWATSNYKILFGQGTLIFLLQGTLLDSMRILADVHVMLGYGPAFNFSFFQEEFLISSGLSQTPVLSWNCDSDFNMYETDSYGCEENIAQLIKVLQITFHTKIRNLFTDVMAPCQRVIYWVCCHCRQRELSKLV